MSLQIVAYYQFNTVRKFVVKFEINYYVKEDKAVSWFNVPIYIKKTILWYIKN